jgi:BirA family biotin operon repressor/biotin-[acetyl-CoA-carboxylase] ligase
VPTPTWGWVPLLAGVALAQTVGSDAQLKWPNDVLLGDQARKVAGILVQSAAGVAVVGIGLNVTTTLEELPVPTATSLSIEGLATSSDRENLLGEFLRTFDRLYRAWQAASGDAEASGLAAAYRSLCGTIGQRVSVQQPDGELIGEAIGVDADGQLLVRATDRGEPVAVAAGDVTHLRAISR